MALYHERELFTTPNPLLCKEEERRLFSPPYEGGVGGGKEIPRKEMKMRLYFKGASMMRVELRTQWPILALCLALLFWARAGQAQIVSASATPTSLPAAGGNVTIQIVVSKTITVSSVTAYANGGSLGDLAAAGTDSSGNSVYSAVFTVGTNTTNLPRSFAYTYKITDTANNNYTGAVGTTDQASPRRH